MHYWMFLLIKIWAKYSTESLECIIENVFEQIIHNVWDFESNFTDLSHIASSVYKTHTHSFYSPKSHTITQQACTHSIVTSCHGCLFICFCSLAFCPFCLLFCWCECLTSFLCVFLSVPSCLNPSHLFSHIFWSSHRSLFLPPTSPWLSICALSSCFPSLLLSPSLSLRLGLSLFLSLTLSLPPLPLPSAFRGELQSQLFILELLQAHHDGILVHAGLSSAGHQPHTHQLLLHTPHQLCCAHGPRGGQGRRLLSSACQEGRAGSKGQLFIIWLVMAGKARGDML